MSHQAFAQLNASFAQSFANPRNAAAGTLRQLDVNVVANRNLSSFFYMIPNPLTFNLVKQDEVLKFIGHQGISLEKHTKIVCGVDEAIKTYQTLLTLKDKLGYDVDGMVLKVNNIKLYEDIGYTAKYPKFMIAYKFPEMVAVTTLLDIFPTIGRTGRVTYNAKLKPITLGGTTVSFATLHNGDYVRKRNINVGDEIKVKKSGEIIPRVLGVANKHNNHQ